MTQLSVQSIDNSCINPNLATCPASSRGNSDVLDLSCVLTATCGIDDHSRCHTARSDWPHSIIVSTTCSEEEGSAEEPAAPHLGMQKIIDQIKRYLEGASDLEWLKWTAAQLPRCDIKSRDIEWKPLECSGSVLILVGIIAGTICWIGRPYYRQYVRKCRRRKLEARLRELKNEKDKNRYDVDPSSSEPDWSSEDENGGAKSGVSDSSAEASIPTKRRHSTGTTTVDETLVAGQTSLCLVESRRPGTTYFSAISTSNGVALKAETFYNGKMIGYQIRQIPFAESHESNDISALLSQCPLLDNWHSQTICN
ncbi:hypothetical protein FFLO_05226 [Filobasidium floriforme]|uniref:Uncharacterized protein n=1 Tax=Filobasidium floriforme TaxID=5210 RepID=A0A8K0JMT5_9TREE|nr:uncharacterized protein HD553DRAFT_367822 [Filobasidium floriforme]KAG7530178.1 hypothetical protein FFLO_05226 [Filobasidium floriforme]KAH8087240.1 hypothetical protein HD553DRAFT_367822 [Filobasidium floriforme]